MATYDPTKPPVSLQDVIAAAPPEPAVTGATRLLTADMKTVTVSGLPFAQPQEVVFGSATAYANFVTGYALDGLPNADTQAAIDYVLAQGYPEWVIQWYFLGEQVEGTALAADSLSITPQISAADLYGILAADGLTLTPMVATAELLPVGPAAADSLSLTPQVGTGAATGILAADSVTLTPSIGAADLIEDGEAAADSITITPQIGSAELVLVPSVTVTLYPAPGAVIVYTLDGTDPMDYIVTDGGVALFDNGELITTGDVRI